MLEIEHLASKLIRVSVNECDLVCEILSEDGLSDGHSDVSDADDGDFGAAVGRDRRIGVEDGFEKGACEIQPTWTER